MSDLPLQAFTIVTRLTPVISDAVLCEILGTAANFSASSIASPCVSAFTYYEGSAEFLRLGIGRRHTRSPEW